VDPQTLPAERQWWARFCGPLAADRGARARLRRARSAQEALAEPAAIVLVRMLNAAPPEGATGDARTTRALNLARVLAAVREDTPDQRLMRQAGWKAFPGDRKYVDVAVAERPCLSPERFRRLMAVATEDDLVRAFIRLIDHLEGKASVTQLRWDFTLWTHPERGDEIRRRWAFEYYNAGVPAQTNSFTAS
jgi:CRISPR type I-E-associated protein CasB/Cse2